MTKIDLFMNVMREHRLICPVMRCFIKWSLLRKLNLSSKIVVLFEKLLINQKHFSTSKSIVEEKYIQSFSLAMQGKVQ